MRLIDEEQLVITGNYKEIDGEIYIKAADVERCLDDAPTAYDPDKVVEQLEAEKDEHFFGTHDEEREAYCMGVDDAIEIVKKGGVE